MSRQAPNMQGGTAQVRQAQILCSQVRCSAAEGTSTANKQCAARRPPRQRAMRPGSAAAPHSTACRHVTPPDLRAVTCSKNMQGIPCTTYGGPAACIGPHVAARDYAAHAHMRRCHTCVFYVGVCELLGWVSAHHHHQTSHCRQSAALLGPQPVRTPSLPAAPWLVTFTQMQQAFQLHRAYQCAHQSCVQDALQRLRPTGTTGDAAAPPPLIPHAPAGPHTAQGNNASAAIPCPAPLRLVPNPHSSPSANILQHTGQHYATSHQCACSIPNPSCPFGGPALIRVVFWSPGAGRGPAHTRSPPHQRTARVKATPPRTGNKLLRQTVSSSIL